jgi:acyl carrier protein
MAPGIAKVLRILNLDEDELVATRSFYDLPGWDSIMQMQMVVVIESDLGLELSAEEIQDLTPKKLHDLYSD